MLFLERAGATRTRGKQIPGIHFVRLCTCYSSTRTKSENKQSNPPPRSDFACETVKQYVQQCMFIVPAFCGRRDSLLSVWFDVLLHPVPASCGRVRGKPSRRVQRTVQVSRLELRRLEPFRCRAYSGFLLAFLYRMGALRVAPLSRRFPQRLPRTAI